MADIIPVTPPRQIHPNQLCFVTVRAVNRCYRFAPTPRVIETIWYCLAVTLAKYRGRIAMHELLWMSNHYHLVLTDQAGCLPRFMEQLNSLLARALNSIHGTIGTTIEKGYNLVAVADEHKLVEHCIYTLANPCSAHLVDRSHHWKGVSSRRLKYGVAIAIKRPMGALWGNKTRESDDATARESKRASHTSRSKLPSQVDLVLERPPVLPELTDERLRRHILEQLRQREQTLISDRRSRRTRVLGWDAATRVSPTSVPTQPEERFGMTPSYSASTTSARVQAWERRRRFLESYYDALRRFLCGEWTTEFPEGTWLMKVRFGVSCRPLPAT